MTSMSGYFGEAPVDLGPLDLSEWEEFMHYLYLPVRLPLHEGGDLEDDDATLPPRLEFARSAIYAAINDYAQLTDHNDPYVYVSAKRGFAVPGAPGNRPGWHTDDFGGDDLNYIWSDTYPTRWLRGSKPLNIPEDDAESMLKMDWLAKWSKRPQIGDDMHGLSIHDMPAGHLMRLTPYVIHDTPVIPPPGGMRSFLKISVSQHRYAKRGNSRNYDLDYDWSVEDRFEGRNHQSVGS
jgi:hypothetical protein